MTDTIGTMPSKGTKRRTIRIDDELWEAALAKAEEHGESLPAEIRRFLEQYVADE